MIKKPLFLLIALLISVVFTSVAQQKVGRWTLYPSVDNTFTNIVDTPDRTYMLSSPSLFSISDEDNESYAYNYTNKLSDRNPVTYVAYNKDKKYLFVAYSNGNIDLLYDNGKTVNMPEIKDASITGDRSVLSVTFANDRIYIGTGFGLVVYDDDKYLVLESGIYNQTVNQVVLLGSRLLLVVGGNKVYSAPVDGRHTGLDRFVSHTGFAPSSMIALDDNSVLYTIAKDKKLYRKTYNFDNNTESVTTVKTLADVPVAVRESDNGAYCKAGSEITLVAPDGTTSSVRTPAEFASADAFMDDLSSVWLSNEDGITRFDLTGDSPAITMQTFTPEAVTTDQPVNMKWSADGQKLYLANEMYSFIYPFMVPDPYRNYAKVSVLSNGIVRNVMPNIVDPGPTVCKDFTYLQNTELKTKQLISGCTSIAIDPDDQDMFYVGSWLGGLFVFKNGELYKFLNPNNTSFTSLTDGVAFVDIDPKGNLWLVSVVGETALPAQFVMLPAEKRRDIANAKPEDWKIVTVPEFLPARDVNMTYCKKNPVYVFTDGAWEPTVYFMWHNNTPSDLSDDKIVLFKHGEITDQTGKGITPRFIGSITEDHDGKLWIGMHTGVVVLDNVADAQKSSLSVRRPIVARNDGTGLGDYLLDAHVVYCIEIDASNRKWIGTNSGAYLVSADGTEILVHYTTENSPMPSDHVGAIKCDPYSNKVYFGTSNGLVCYDSDSSPAADDYSQVYAYPNPVRPEYTGWITVAGLMDNSLVKIADASGNVFFQGRSEGGMISWDGCDQGGRRVKSGVYFVFASQSDEGASKGAVAKILVIN